MELQVTSYHDITSYYHYIFSQYHYTEPKNVLREKYDAYYVWMIFLRYLILTILMSLISNMVGK